MKVTLGGDRLGSGNKNKIALRNYERSTHNLDAKFTSSMQCGVLYPFSIIPAMRGDSFTIDVDADARTIPTKGPLFGSFKMQIDYFQCPFRLYQAILHNNPLALGLKMNQVKFPVLYVKGGTGAEATMRMNNSCLLKYLGFSGLGTRAGQMGSEHCRTINAMPVLAYYEIFKTYYSNKQETNAYVISASETEIESTVNDTVLNGSVTSIDTEILFENLPTYNKLVIRYSDYVTQNMIDNTLIQLGIVDGSDSAYTLKEIKDVLDKNHIGQLFKYEKDGTNTIVITFAKAALIIAWNLLGNEDTADFMLVPEDTYTDIIDNTIKLLPFALSNIDDMRLALLSKHELGVPFKIGQFEAAIEYADWGKTSGGDGSGLPYYTLFKYVASNKPANMFPLNGLVVKTYQSDLFNNWVKTEWIDGENGISAITAISTSEGSFTIDTLNLSEKLYNMLNRIAVSDGSYEGWQDAVYTESPKRHIESPVYLGGSSNEIVFEEIVQTSETNGDNALGTLGGKGKLIKRKGGHVHVKVDEASFIIGIVSLTPRVNYTQGNEWYLTDLQSMDDLHKPALDGIGFENLIGERLFYKDTIIAGNNGKPQTRHTIGKVPAWINYMTRIDKGYGDFAETEGKGFMLLQRNYEFDATNKVIKDATTYIDPAKYNYAFAYTLLDSQNFWVQIYEHVVARRLMSAKQIPNI